MTKSFDFDLEILESESKNSIFFNQLTKSFDSDLKIFESESFDSNI